MGLYDDQYSLIADRSTLVDGSSGVEIFPDLAPAPDEHVIKKYRYSAFFATDLDLILREWGITTVIISGTLPKTVPTPQHVTRCSIITRLYSFRTRPARSTIPTLGMGPCRRGGAQGHPCTLGFSTAHVMTVDEFKARVTRSTRRLAGKA